MKISEVFVVIMAIVGLTTIINPDAIDSIKEPLTILCQCAIAIVLLEILPKMLKKLKNNNLIDLISIFVFPISVAIAIFIVNPGIDPGIIEPLMFVLVLLGILSSNIIKRHFVKKWGVEINSSHPDNE